MDPNILKRLINASTGGKPTVLATIIEPGESELQVGAKLLIELDGNTI